MQIFRHSVGKSLSDTLNPKENTSEGLSLDAIQFSHKHKKVLDDNAPNIILYGGYGSGKSDLAIYRFLKNIENGDKTCSGIAIHYSLGTLRARFNEFFDSYSIPLHISKTGSEFRWKDRNISLFGADDERQFQRIRSRNVQHLYLEEVTLPSFQETTMREAITRVRAKAGVPLSITIATNPPSPQHWLYTSYFPTFETYKFSTFDNEHINPKEYVKNLGLPYQDTTKFLYKRYVAGEIVNDEEAIFSNIGIGDFELFEKAPPSHMVGCIDPSYGGADFTALVYGFEDRQGKFYFMVESFRANNFEDNFGWLMQRINELKIDTVFVEDNGDKGLLAERMNNSMGHNKTYVQTFRSSANKQNRILKTLTLYSHRITLSHKSDTDAIERIRSWGFRARHDDEIDALANWFIAQGRYVSV